MQIPWLQASLCQNLPVLRVPDRASLRTQSKELSINAILDIPDDGPGYVLVQRLTQPGSRGIMQSRHLRHTEQY